MDIPQIDLAATGTNIRRMRKARGISVVEISEKLMIDKQAVYRWEYGKSLPQLENCLALARMFHTTIEDILIEKGETISSLPSLLRFFRIFSRFFTGRVSLKVPAVSIRQHAPFCPSFLRHPL